MLELRQLIYVSVISPGLTKAAERQIVGTAKRNNRISGLTGLIASSGNYFLQVLEGSHRAIDEMLGALLLDERHRDIKVLFDRSIGTRRYASWSMAYIHSLDLADELANLHSGLTRADVDSLLAEFDPHDIGDSIFSRSGFR